MTSSARFKGSNLDVTLDTVPAENGFHHPRFRGIGEGQPPFSSVMSAVATTSGQSASMLVPLDPNSNDLEIVFSAFWGDAHCCTVTEVFSVVCDHWVRTAASTLDGGGYQFRDLDGDGSLELLSNDNRFLYALAPYAASWPPTVVEQLRDGQLSNQSRAFSFARFHRRELAGNVVPL